MDFAITADQRVKIKEIEKRGKYLDLVRELRKLWNMRVTVIPIVIGTLGTVPKGLERGWKNFKSEEVSKSSKLQHCCDWLEYWEES